MNGSAGGLGSWQGAQTGHQHPTPGSPGTHLCACAPSSTSARSPNTRAARSPSTTSCAHSNQGLGFDEAPSRWTPNPSAHLFSLAPPSVEPCHKAGAPAWPSAMLLLLLLICQPLTSPSGLPPLPLSPLPPIPSPPSHPLLPQDPNQPPTWLSALLLLSRPLMIAPTMYTSQASCPSSTAACAPGSGLVAACRVERMRGKGATQHTQHT